MIYKHKYFKQDFLENKHIQNIEADRPLIIVVEQQQFLHYTIEKSLFYLGIPHFITTLKKEDLEEGRKNMGHELPVLIYENQVLEASELIEFICDAFLNGCESIDFQARKAYIKQTVKIWKQIFIFEKLHPYDYKKLKTLEIKNQKDYFNLVMQQLHILSVNFCGKNIQRAFADFSDNTPNLQNILFVDIISTILRKTSESYLDHSLRDTYEKLIGHHQFLKQQIKDMLPRQNVEGHKIVLQKSIQKEEEYPVFSFNPKIFFTAFGVASTLYYVFVKS